MNKARESHKCRACRRPLTSPAKCGFLLPIEDDMTDTDIGTLEQEIRQVRARLARVEGERDELLVALDSIANESTRNLGSARIIARAAIASVKGGA